MKSEEHPTLGIGHLVVNTKEYMLYELPIGKALVEPDK
jgi:hypothetical protein